MEEYQNIAIGFLKESKHNPRRTFDAKFLKELEASIREKGVINPLIVRPNGAGAGHYEILAGANRFRAAKAAGLETIPVIVKELDDRAAMELMLLDNLQRAGVHPLEEARGYKGLIAMGSAPAEPGGEVGPVTVEDVAAKIGKSGKYVYDRLKLLDLAPEAEKMFTAGKINAGHAILLARLDEVEQSEVLTELADELTDEEYGISVRDLENEIRWRRERKKRDAVAAVIRAKQAKGKGRATKEDREALRAKENARLAREEAKRKAERDSRVETVKAVLAKVVWPLPRAVLELVANSDRAAKMKEVELGQHLVKQICGHYESEYWWDGGVVAKLAKIYKVAAVKAKTEESKSAKVEKPAKKKPRSKKKKLQTSAKRKVA